jgi:hypothetical protein
LRSDGCGSGTDQSGFEDTSQQEAAAGAHWGLTAIRTGVAKYANLPAPWHKMAFAAPVISTDNLVDPGCK